jgi:hypothetical protein
MGSCSFHLLKHHRRFVRGIGLLLLAAPVKAHHSGSMAVFGVQFRRLDM